jgi:decaprenylphospho-beta-D-ribofuranose 2-oxidase
MADHQRRRPVTGWGSTAPTVARVVPARGEAEVRAALHLADDRGVIARGLGRSYGAPAQNAGGLVLELADDQGAMVLDPVEGTVRVAAGVSLDALLRHLVPRGWFVPVTPGTRAVTIGGAIAADIHGKNHHRDGSFGQHVTTMQLMLADGSVREIGPEQDPALYWATVGGMGLTGIVLEATIRLLPITTSRMLIDTERTTDLDDLCARMAEGDHRYRYSVAWIDLLATGRHLGRGVLTRGDHADVAHLPARARLVPLEYGPGALVTAPPLVPDGLLNPFTVRAFNEVWYRKAPRGPHSGLESIGYFFHPLDLVRSWNRMYGRHGFVQYQFAVPFGAEDVLRRVVERLSRSHAPSFLAVLKRFGDANPAPLSFPMPGWTLALDLAAGRRGVPEMFAELDRWVLDAGGRHYLAKDAHLRPDALTAAYPRLEEWRAVRDKADPTGVWVSDLARRLRLVG